MAAILTCGFTMTLCTSIEENPVAPVNPAELSDIIDEFWDMPGNEGAPPSWLPCSRWRTWKT